MLNTIISSGQRGTEQAGLASAWTNNIQTSGYIPEGYKVSYGKEIKSQESLKIFELHQVENGKLGECLRKNIESSDGTVIFNLRNSEETVPEKVAREYCETKMKPVISVPIDDSVGTGMIKTFVEKNNIKVLHVTGRMDRTETKYIYDSVYKQMNDFFKENRKIVKKKP